MASISTNFSPHTGTQTSMRNSIGSKDLDIPPSIGWHENSVLNFLNKMLYNLERTNATAAILNDETYYLTEPNDDFASKTPSNDGSRPTFIPFSEVIKIVNSDDNIKNKKAILNVVALKRLRLVKFILYKESILQNDRAYVMRWASSSSENMYLNEHGDVDFIKIYNEAYAAEIAAPATVHRIQKQIYPLLYWNVEEQKFKLLIEPTPGKNRRRKQIEKNKGKFLVAPKIDEMQSSLMHHHALNYNEEFQKNQEKLSKLPDTMKIIHIKDGEPSEDNIESTSVPFIKLPGPKYSMDELKNILTAVESQDTLDYIKYFYKKLDNALNEYYTKIVITFKKTDDELHLEGLNYRANQEMLKAMGVTESKHWSDFSEPKRAIYDPRRYFGYGGDGGIISGPLIMGGICMASPFITNMYSRSKKATLAAEMLIKTNEHYSNFMNEMYGSILGGDKKKSNFKEKFKSILGKEPTFNNLAKFLTSGESLGDDNINLSEALEGPAGEIQNIQNMIGNQGQGAIAGPVISENEREAAEQALIDMGRRIVALPPNENSEQVVNDVLALPAPVQQKYDKNKMSLTKMFESANIDSKQNYINRFYKGTTEFLKALSADIRENTELVKEKIKKDALFKDIKSVREYYDKVREGIEEQNRKRLEYEDLSILEKLLSNLEDFANFSPKAVDYGDKALQLHNAYESGKIPVALSNAIGLGFASLAKKKAQVELLASEWDEFMKGLKTVVARINLAVATITQAYYEVVSGLLIETNKIDTHTKWGGIGIAAACALGTGGVSWGKASGLLNNPSTAAIASGMQRIQQALPVAGTASAAAGTIVQYSASAAANTVANKAAQAHILSIISGSAGSAIGSLLAYQDVEDALNNVFEPKLNPEIRENLNNLLDNPSISDLDAAIDATEPGQLVLLSDKDFKKEVVGPEIASPPPPPPTTNTDTYPTNPEVLAVLNDPQTLREGMQGQIPHPGALLNVGGKRKKKKRTRRKLKKKKRTRRKLKKRKKKTSGKRKKKRRTRRRKK